MPRSAPARRDCGGTRARRTRAAGSARFRASRTCLGPQGNLRTARRRSEMPVPSRAQLLKWADGYVELWNAGDKLAWEQNWRDVAPGEFRMLDPVGTPERRGFEACA